MRRRAFSLLELVLSASLLLFVMSVMFGIFRFGSQSFRVATGRNDMQSDARAVLSRLGQDLEHSTYLGVSMDNGALRVSNGQPRHLVCMPSVLDWNDLASFDAQTGCPNWDSYILYHPGLQTDGARLFRVELGVANLSGQSWPDFSGYATTYLANPAPKNTNINGVSVRTLRALASNLRAFEVSKTGKQVIVVLKLQSRAQAALEGGKQRDEILEVRARYVPKNQAS